MGHWYILLSKGASIHNNGGFREELKRERLSAEIKEQIDKATIKMADSVVATNKSVSDTNDSIITTNSALKTTNILMTVIAGITGIFVALQFFKSGEPDLQPINTQLERQVQILDSMRRVQTEIGSSLEIMAEDSSKKK